MYWSEERSAVLKVLLVYLRSHHEYLLEVGLQRTGSSLMLALMLTALVACRLVLL